MAAVCVVLATLTEQLQNQSSRHLKSDTLAQMPLVKEAKKSYEVPGFTFLILLFLAQLHASCLILAKLYPAPTCTNLIQRGSYDDLDRSEQLGIPTPEDYLAGLQW